ncbi:hypothetical protein AB0D46_00930 [Streptomyces sp. NPDC048383]|uniref:hypothetical protein n=1 Tax=Streptomyces sp. NPDC048383 TaxID=3155386 RepID=UPI00342428E5
MLGSGRHDLVVTTSRPRGGLFAASTPCDEELVLVAVPHGAALVDPAHRLRAAAHW